MLGETAVRRRIHREALHAITGHRAPENDDVESRLFGRKCLLQRPTDPKMDDDIILLSCYRFCEGASLLGRLDDVAALDFNNLTR